MIRIKPAILQQSHCPYCHTALNPQGILWQGMHICVESECPKCHARIIEDLPVGHAINWPYQVDLERNVVFGREEANHWLGKPLQQSLQNPQTEKIAIQQEVLKECRQVILLNCIDSLYGHSLLKLLNAQKHLENDPEFGLIVIVPAFLRWLVPEGVAEIWTVDISLKQGQFYYPNFHEFVSGQLERFAEVFISEAYSHPYDFDITRFTRVPRHGFHEALRVTFIWREDRLWIQALLPRILRKLGLTSAILAMQNRKVVKLFQAIRSEVDSVQFAVAGLGTKTRFPDWIEDFRVKKFDQESERALCKLYSDSRLVIGVHGSNLLLPSAHAGMTIDLLPPDRVNNFAQDILYQEDDPRVASFRYRYLPTDTSHASLTRIAISMLKKYDIFRTRMIPKSGGFRSV